MSEIEIEGEITVASSDDAAYAQVLDRLSELDETISALDEDAILTNNQFDDTLGWWAQVQNGHRVKVGDEWISVKEVESILYPNPLTGKKMGISIDGEIYQVEDEYVINMLKSFTDGNILHQIFGTFKNKK